ncbi:MAG: hypothetical protein HQL46_07455 [Gammaproteobacteria bacterium]|nr:hypothetical protein [Gammaproteobacteria bacterium]
MSNCCSSSKSPSQAEKKHPCPVNNNLCNHVSNRTVLHHVKQSWNVDTSKVYYYCDDLHCDVCYFSRDNIVISQMQCHTKVKGNLLCHCFNITEEEYLSNPSIKDFVIEQTKLGQCSCETSNPSGKCCLKDFA